jgi:uncharacterized membrane protein YphA (DoxX/SURF4 family)
VIVCKEHKLEDTIKGLIIIGVILMASGLLEIVGLFVAFGDRKPEDLGRPHEIVIITWTVLGGVSIIVGVILLLIALAIALF